MRRNKNYEIDMCSGPVLSKVIRFAIPVMFSSILQMLYNAADMAVVGRFAGSQALAAVGSNGPQINLVISLCTGLSVGVSVCIAREYGARNTKGVQDYLHTSVLLGFLCGILFMLLGLFLSRPMLKMMGTPEDVLAPSALYLTIIFVGMPANMVYNFGAAAMRAVGDTRRPTTYLMISGLLNVGLNLVFVLGFGMAAGGVALATILSQGLSASLVILRMLRSKDVLTLSLKRLKIHRRALLEIVKIGLPAGVEGCLFSISNVLIQSSINSFGSMAMAGNAAASNIDSMVNITCYSISTAAMTFAGQNMGAKKYKRIIRLALTCAGTIFVVATVMSQMGMLFSRQLLSLYTSEAEAIAFGQIRLKYLFFAGDI